eukprot:g3233.t1
MLRLIIASIFLLFTFAQPSKKTADPRLQPIYHTPGVGSNGYAGDPNGLMFREDTQLYHFFWQRIAPTWPGSQVRWGHAISKDFARWTRLPDALPPGSFSGGATQYVDQDGRTNVKMLYKDTHRQNGFFTAQPSNLSDPNLTVWVESKTASSMKGSTDPSAGWTVSSGKGFWAVVGATGNHSSTQHPTGAVTLWEANASFGNFTATGVDLYEFPWDRKNGEGGPGDKYESSVPRDPNFFKVNNRETVGLVREEQSSEDLWAFEGAMKMCFYAGHDFYVLGTFDESERSFKLDDEDRTMGSDPFDVGGMLYASQTFSGKDGIQITSSWVLEGDCDWMSGTFPPKCEAMYNRGWLGVHSLPKVVTVETLPPLLPSSGKEHHALKFAPLPALANLRTGETSSLSNITSSTDTSTLPNFHSASFQLDLNFKLPTTSQWNVGADVLKSDDGKEYTRVGLRDATWMEGAELVFVNDAQRKKATSEGACTGGERQVSTASECQKQCTSISSCLGWTSIPIPMSLKQNCTLVCDIVPLLSVSSQDCNWGSLHDPRNSTSGMIARGKYRWTQVYMNRTQSSKVTDAKYEFPYAGIVRIVDEENVEDGSASVSLNIFVDKSIVEVFVMEGRTVLTGRVYPDDPTSNNVDLFVEGLGIAVNANAWAMGNAFENE